MLDIYAMVVPNSDSKYVYTNFIGAGDIYAMVVPSSDGKYVYPNCIGAGACGVDFSIIQTVFYSDVGHSCSNNYQ